MDPIIPSTSEIIHIIVMFLMYLIFILIRPLDNIGPKRERVSSWDIEAGIPRSVAASRVMEVARRLAVSVVGPIL